MQDRNAQLSIGTVRTRPELGVPALERQRSFSLLRLTAIVALALATALTASAAVPQQCVAPPNSTAVAWFPFDETTGGATANLATQNGGTLGGAATFIPGLVGNALHFDGGDAMFRLPSSPTSVRVSPLADRVRALTPPVQAGFRSIYGSEFPSIWMIQ